MIARRTSGIVAVRWTVDAMITRRMTAAARQTEKLQPFAQSHPCELPIPH
jgi:hypothetical protein